MRNLSIALAIAINAFGPQGSSAALVVAMAYIIQVQSAAWYVKFADTLFGKKGCRAPLPGAGHGGSPAPAATAFAPAKAPKNQRPGREAHHWKLITQR